MQSASHTYKITNLVGSTGGNYSEAAPALNYNTYSITITAPVTPGTVYSGSEVELITCSAAGTIFNGGGGLYIEVAYTRAVSTGAQSNCYWNQKITQEVCDISAQVWCTAASSPPDYPVAAVSSQVYPPPAPNWWETFDVCVAYGSPGHYRPWLCSPFGLALEQYTALPAPAICTYNP
jgi:hypothetical protein